jgi:four helix bundle protein
MEKFILRDKSFDFSLKCISLFRFLNEQKREFIISKQFLRSGTSVGAMINEAKFAESIPDFIHKYSIALKECNETIYWIDLLHYSQYINPEQHENVYQLAVEIRKMLTSSILTLKQKHQIQTKVKL